MAEPDIGKGRVKVLSPQRVKQTLKHSEGSIVIQRCTTYYRTGAIHRDNDEMNRRICEKVI